MNQTEPELEIQFFAEVTAIARVAPEISPLRLLCALTAFPISGDQKVPVLEELPIPK
jgi:hypothetical protein